MGKPRDKPNGKSRNGATKKGESSNKSLRTRKTDWNEQPEEVHHNFEHLCLSSKESDDESSRMSL